jgi:hypothetical protein
MSRQTLCVVTAAALAGLSVGLAALRYHALGSEVAAPTGPGTYHVTLLVRGKGAGDVRVTTACPLDLSRQHIFREEYHSDELAHRPPDVHRPDRRVVQWSPATPGGTPASFEARYEFFCRMNVHHPTAPMTALGEKLYTAPGAGECLKAEQHIEVSDPAVSQRALALTRSLTRPADQARALYQYVSQEVAAEPAVGGSSLSAVECLKAGRGDAAAKSRLLVALCRNRGIPARLVTGLTLARPSEQQAHTWAEAWVGDQWMPFCPFHHHSGRVPPTYLAFGFGDLPLARGHNVRSVSYACLAEHRPPAAEDEAAQPLLRRVFEAISLDNLPPAERSFAEFLLLLPLAALLICVFRNVIGLGSFGTFAPALIGLAFRHAGSLPGLLVFVSIVLVGWGLRRILDRYHLLQVPRIAFLLSMVVTVLLAGVVVASAQHLSPTRYIDLFPMIILTGMIERFWTLEAEDGTLSSFKALVGTVIISLTISLLLGLPAVAAHMFRYPETLGVIMALQLLLGRYTGYRLSELLRFRDLVRRPQGPHLYTPRPEHMSITVAGIERTEQGWRR